MDMVYHKVQWRLATDGGTVQMLSGLDFGLEFRSARAGQRGETDRG